jgi:S1-C subfamily serine protease
MKQKHLNGIKKQLDKIFDLSLKIIKATAVLATKLTVYVALITGFTLLAVKAPELHGRWIRESVGSKVYLMTNDAKRGSGTGFAVKGKSGVSYIVTNDHVCAMATDGTMLVIDRDGNEFKRRIIERSNFTDLCLVEGLPGVEGMTIGSEPEIGQIIAAVGHPSGYDITLTRGEIIQREDVLILEGPISFFDPSTNKEFLISEEEGGILAENCNKPKNVILTQMQDFGFFQLRVKWCINKTNKAYYTNMAIQPGSSGSPIVNFWGNVVGVVFAGDRAMWGITVSNKDLTKFLKNY